MKKTHRPYGDTAPRLGSELDPLTWKERFWGAVIVLVIAIITVEVISRVASLF